MSEKKRYYRKRTELFLLINKMKLWPAKSGKLHGIKNMEIIGEYAVITTHCDETFRIRDSRKSRAARWLRNKWVAEPCKKCNIPEWKIEKYNNTFFSQNFGSDLKNTEKRQD